MTLDTDRPAPGSAPSSSLLVGFAAFEFARRRFARDGARSQDEIEAEIDARGAPA